MRVKLNKKYAFFLTSTDDKEIVANALQILLEWNPEEGAVAPEAFDASGGVEVIPVEHGHEVKVDKAMALWAQAACGHITVCVSGIHCILDIISKERLGVHFFKI